MRTQLLKKKFGFSRIGTAALILMLITCAATPTLSHAGLFVKTPTPPSPENDSQLPNKKLLGKDALIEFPDLEQLKPVNLGEVLDTKKSIMLARCKKKLDKKSFCALVDGLLTKGYIFTSYANAWTDMKKRNIREDETAIEICDEGVTSFVDSASRNENIKGEVCSLKTVLKYIYDKITGDIIFHPTRYD